MLDHLFAPLAVGPAELPCRIVSTAHQTTLLHDHLPTDDFVAYQQARARGGAGLIVMEAVAISPSGLLTAHTIGGYLDGMVDGYRRVAVRAAEPPLPHRAAGAADRRGRGDRRRVRTLRRDRGGRRARRDRGHRGARLPRRAVLLPRVEPPRRPLRRARALRDRGARGRAGRGPSAGARRAAERRLRG